MNIQNPNEQEIRIHMHVIWWYIKKLTIEKHIQNWKGKGPMNNSSTREQ